MIVYDCRRNMNKEGREKVREEIGREIEVAGDEEMSLEEWRVKNEDNKRRGMKAVKEDE